MMERAAAYSSPCASTRSQPCSRAGNWPVQVGQAADRQRCANIGMPKGSCGNPAPDGDVLELVHSSAATGRLAKRMYAFRSKLIPLSKSSINDYEQNSKHLQQDMAPPVVISTHLNLDAGCAHRWQLPIGGPFVQPVGRAG